MNIRTIHTACIELRRIDPDTAVTEYFLRRLCKEGILPHTKSGQKYLLDMNTLKRYLAQNTGDTVDFFPSQDHLQRVG